MDAVGNAAATQREGLVCPATKGLPGELRVLALDGGGVRGALVAGFLERVEADLRTQHDNSQLKLGDCVDLIVGTSTGGIIAALLATGKDAQQAAAAYEELGPVAFPKPTNPWLLYVITVLISALASALAVGIVTRLAWSVCYAWYQYKRIDATQFLEHFTFVVASWQSFVVVLLTLFVVFSLLYWYMKWQIKLPLYQLFFAKFRPQNLLTELERKLGVHTTLNDARRRLMLTALNLEGNKTLIMKTDHKRRKAGMKADEADPPQAFYLAEAVRSTSAAPSYFQPMKTSQVDPTAQQRQPSGHVNADGGLWANNPALLGYVEALKIRRAWQAAHPGNQRVVIKLLSVGTGLPGNSAFKAPRLGFGMIWWAKPLIAALWEGPPQNVMVMLSEIIPDNARFVRINFSLTQSGLRSLDNPANIPSLLDIGQGLSPARPGRAVVENDPGADPYLRTLQWFTTPSSPVGQGPAGQAGGGAAGSVQTS